MNAMIRRLFTVLLALCLAMPAMAMPLVHATAGPSQAADHAAGHHEHGDRQQPVNPNHAAHQCIGCIASFAPATAQARLAPLAGVVEAPGGTTGLDPHQTSPEPPPPRA
jgi:hypothetical protein